MAKRGPKPTPTQKLKQRGSWRAKTRKAEPAAPSGVPDCPSHLKGDARAEWDRQVKLLAGTGILSTIDGPALAAYCIAYARWVKAEMKLEEVGEVVITESGYECKSGWLLVADKAMEQMHKFASEFGLTPASRSRVTKVEAEKPEKDGKARFFNAKLAS